MIGTLANPVVIYGHPYQPLREIVALRPRHTLNIRSQHEGSAHPFKNWTAKITAQCYRPLADSGAMSHLGFDLAPTLALQLPREVLRLFAIADRSSAIALGHGNALAHPFFHTILPLDAPWARKVNIVWGKKYFEQLFDRQAEGAWAPECAIDLPTLQEFADTGFKFTVISPFSVQEIDHGGQGGWEKIRVSSDPLPLFDHSLPRQVALGNGQRFTVFPYDPFLAREFAFGQMLNQPPADELGRQINNRLHNWFGGHAAVPIVVDLETFGHHKEQGVMVLNDYLSRIARTYGHQLTNFGRLRAEAERANIIGEAKLWLPSAWSCAHGIDRWRADCGCYHANPWRAGLRDALNGLAEKFDHIFIQQTSALLKDPYRSAEEYISVLIGQQSFPDLINEGKKGGTDIGAARLAKLGNLFDGLFPRLAMFTSCAWFFEGMGLETGLSLGYADQLLRTLAEEGKLTPAYRAKFYRTLQAVTNSPGAAGRNQLPDALQILRSQQRDQKEQAKKVELART